MEIVADGNPPVPATEASVRAAFDPEDGFWDFVTLCRGESEFSRPGTGGSWAARRIPRSGTPPSTR
jgi:hypothetical protein